MAHIDPVSGQWVEDADGPVPSVPDAGSIGAQANPALPPVEPQPPPPPPANMVKIDQPFTITAGPGVPAAPASAPAAPVAPPPSAMPAPAAAPIAPVKGPNQLVTSQKLPTQGELNARADIAGDNAAQLATAAKAGDLKVQQAQAAADHLDAYQEMLQKQADQRAQLQAAWEARKARDSELIAKAREDGTKDPDAGESWTHRLLRALAIGLGQYSAAMNHTDNMAAKIFEDDYKQKQQRQKDKIAAAEKAGELTAEQAKQALADLDAKGAGQVAAFNAKWQAESARLGVPQARIDADANTLALKRMQDEANQKLLAEDRVTVRDETPKEMRQGKGGGGGGGLGKEAQLAAYLEQNPGDMKGAYALAAKLGMNRKAADDVFAREKEQSGLARTEADKFASENGLNAISKQQRELAELSKALTDNAGNPLQQALAVEKAVSAARGGAASRQALALALGHMGGSLDEAEGFIQKIKDGQLGGKQLQNFEAFLNGQRGASQAAGKEAFDRYAQMIQDAPDPGTKVRLIRERARLFSGMDGYGKSEAAPASKPPAATFKIESQKDKALAAQAQALKPGDKNYESAQTWLRAHGL